MTFDIFILHSLVKIWATFWQNKKLDIRCDNLAVIEVLTSGKTKDTFLSTCASNVWLICAIFNIHIRVWHIPGKSNHTADLLSRWTITKDPLNKLYNLLPQFTWVSAPVDLKKLNYNL